MSGSSGSAAYFAGNGGIGVASALANKTGTGQDGYYAGGGIGGDGTNGTPGLGGGGAAGYPGWQNSGGGAGGGQNGGSGVVVIRYTR